jgi:hypothetical protein
MVVQFPGVLLAPTSTIEAKVGPEGELVAEVAGVVPVVVELIELI